MLENKPGYVDNTFMSFLGLVSRQEWSSMGPQAIQEYITTYQEANPNVLNRRSLQAWIDSETNTTLQDVRHRSVIYDLPQYFMF